MAHDVTISQLSSQETAHDVQGDRNLWGQRFSAYFVLKVAPQRGEGGEKKGSANFQK